MFITKITCPQCNGNNVCIEVIKSKIFPEGNLFCAGWVNSEARAYCYTCDEAELTQRAKQTAEDKVFHEAEELRTRKAETMPAPIFHTRPDKQSLDNFVDEQLVPALRTAVEQGSVVLQKACRWCAEDGRNYLQTLLQNWPAMRLQAVEMIRSKVNLGIGQINSLRDQLK